MRSDRVAGTVRDEPRERVVIISLKVRFLGNGASGEMAELPVESTDAEIPFCGLSPGRISEGDREVIMWRLEMVDPPRSCRAASRSRKRHPSGPDARRLATAGAAGGAVSPRLGRRFSAAGE